MSASKKLRAGAFVLATAAIGIIVSSSAASAHRVSLNHGTDHGWVTSDHRSVYVCDNEADNHGVYVEYKTRQSGNRIMVVGDADGSGGNCGHEFAEDGGSIVWGRICEHSEGCARWEAS